MEYSIVTRSLTKYYGGARAIEKINLAVPRGSVYALLGPNGAGKSTTFSLLLGLITPSSGEIELFGQPWRRDLLARVGASINGPALYDHLSATENLEVHARLLRLTPTVVFEALAQVRLTNTGPKPVRQFSMGMRSRLALAIALLTTPDLLILDEPQSGLDPEGIRDLRGLLRGYVREGRTVVVSSHQLGEVSRLADFVGVIAHGELRYQGALMDLAPSDGQFEERYLALTRGEA
ncbi:MAG: ATP-binding cassette domain-containing protein, partial [Hyphomicrobiales bacterium]|nr:ATP-binding cassette domain-containing protein [Hyphomicrobiales bacterium]